MRFFCTAILCMAFSATPAAAYIGPGAGAGAVGVLIAVVLGVALLVAGFVWYPLKRMMRKRRAARTADTDTGKE